MASVVGSPKSKSKNALTFNEPPIEVKLNNISMNYQNAYFFVIVERSPHVGTTKNGDKWFSIRVINPDVRKF